MKDLLLVPDMSESGEDGDTDECDEELPSTASAEVAYQDVPKMLRQAQAAQQRSAKPKIEEVHEHEHSGQ